MAFKKKTVDVEQEVLAAAQQIEAGEALVQQPAELDVELTHVAFDYVQRGERFHVVRISYNPLTNDVKLDKIDEVGQGLQSTLSKLKELMAQESLRRKRSK